MTGQEALAMEGRSLRVQTDDYGGPGSNQKHQPKPNPGGGRGRHRSLLAV